MAAESVRDLKSWVDQANMQLRTTASKFSEMESMLGEVTKYCASLVDLLQDINNVDTEYKTLQKIYSSSLNNIPDMAGSVQFQMESLGRTYALLKRFR